MSLGRLLTSGKSLIGLNQNESRYEMRPKNLLPKFGSDKNPFTTVKPESLQTDFVRKVPTIPRTYTPAEAAAAKLNQTRRLPVVTSIRNESPAEPASGFLVKVMSSVQSGLKKLNPLSWRGESKTQNGPAVPAFDKAPVQTELSLDRIKVVRNDLSEADVEVVPAKISVQSKPEQPAVPPRANVGETAELIKT